MKLLILLVFICYIGIISSAVTPCKRKTYERLSIDNAALLLVDHQTGLANGIRDKSENDFRSALLALAKIAKLFNLPTIITTSNPNGPNGPYIQDIIDTFTNDSAIIIDRPGEINAMDNAEFYTAVKAMNRTKFIVSGIVTEVCVAFVTLSLLQEGYAVYAALDSSGTYSEDAKWAAIDRMVHAGVIPITWFAIASELQLDWRNETGSEFAAIVGTHLPWYGHLISSYQSVYDQYNEDA